MKVNEFHRYNEENLPGNRIHLYISIVGDNIAAIQGRSGVQHNLSSILHISVVLFGIGVKIFLICR